MQRSRRRRFFVLVFLCGALFPRFVAGQSSSSATLAPESASTAASNPYDTELRSLERRAGTASAPEQAVLIHRAYDLRDYVDDREALAQWLVSVAGDSRRDALVRDAAQRLLALIDLHSGRLESARARYEALGFVRAWSIVGPFSSTGLDSAVGPERGYAPSAMYSGGNGQERRWRHIPDLGTNASIDLADFYSRATSSTAFAATSLYSDRERVVALRFTSDTALVLSVNGRVVFTGKEPSNVAFDQHAIAVELHAGWNPVLVKFYRRADEPWRFGLRVTEIGGGGVQLRASPTEPW